MRKLRYRTLNHFTALVLGYFWRPCPLCGKMFGGHEWHYETDSMIMETRSSGELVCPECTEKAERYNRDFYKRLAETENGKN